MSEDDLQRRREANIVAQVIDRARAGIFTGPDITTGSMLERAMNQAALYLAGAFRQAYLHPGLVPACSPEQFRKVADAAMVLANPDATKDELFEAWRAVQSTDDMGSEAQNKIVSEMHDELQRRWEAKRG